MKISLGALSKLHEEWHEADNFYIFFQLDIEFEDTKSGFELFSFEVVSPKWLEALIKENKIELGRGYIIMNDFDIKVLEDKIKHVISVCSSSTIDETIYNLSKFFKYENDCL
jgi:hypothetical protein